MSQNNNGWITKLLNANAWWPKETGAKGAASATHSTLFSVFILLFRQ